MLSAQIAYFVHGRGQGHASRALSVVPALRRAGLTVSVFAAADALPMLESLGEVEPRPLLRTGLKGQRELLGRAWSERATLLRRGVRLVVTDGDQAALLAARLVGLPTIAIGHDLVFSHCALPKGLPYSQLLYQRANALVPALLSARRVAVHFLPTRSLDPRTRAARLEIEAPETTSSVRTERLLCYFRDHGNDHVVRWARAHSADVVVLGRKEAGRELFTRSHFRSLLMSARGAIGSAGSNLLAECIVFGTPLLALYRRDDSEQALNARLLEAANAGVACAFEAVTPGVIERFWQRACAHDFSSVPLLHELPSVVDAVVEATFELLTSKPCGAHQRPVARGASSA